ncbi:MAG: VWA domain-containing protein [Cyclobacteriaceae bacterium]
MKKQTFVWLLLCTVAWQASYAQAQSVVALPDITPSLDLKPPKGQFTERTFEAVTRQTTIQSEGLTINKNEWERIGQWSSLDSEGKTEIVAGNQEKSFLISPEIQMGDELMEIQYREKYKIEDVYDQGSVWATEDNGKTWKQLHVVYGHASWHITKIPLLGYQNKKVRFAFAMSSDESGDGSNWAIEGINVQKMKDQEDLEVGLSSARTSASNAVAAQNAYTAALTNLNAQRFPFIFANIRISGTENILDETCFSVYENNVLQEDYEVQAPDEIEEGGRADIVFIIDNSGSTSPYQNRIRQSVTSFINALEAANIDAAVGLTRFGQSGSGQPIVEEGGNLFTDLEFFLNNIYTRNSASGGTEPGYDAIIASSSQFAFRPGAQRIFILAGDEPNNGSTTPQTAALSALQQNSIILNSVIITNSTQQQSDYGFLATETNGGIYDIRSPDFSPILSDISGAITGSYALRYTSSNPVADGTLRQVEIRIGCNNSVEDVVNGEYTPGASPVITLTQETLNTISSGQPVGADIPISAVIVDAVQPFVTNAILFYKNTNDVNYQQVALTREGTTDSWEGVIPGSVAIVPAVDFYISATDGASTSSLPTDDPIANPFQIAILPNVAPAITFTPIENLCAGEDLKVTATIIDNTNEVANASLFYRGVGELVYEEITLNKNGNQYTASVDASDISEDGIDYYITAKDDQGVSAFEGTPDNPIMATISEILSVTAGTQSVCNVDDNTYTQEVIVEYSNPPTGSELIVNGQPFSVTSSPQTVELTLDSDGDPVDVSASFSGACPYTISELFNAPEPCGETERVPSSLTLSPMNTTVAPNVEICIIGTVLDQFGDPLAGVTVVSERDGIKVGEGTTDENGEVEYCFTPTMEGAVTITCYYLTEDGQEGSRVTATVTVSSVTPQGATTWNGSSWSNGVPDATKDAVIEGDYTSVNDLQGFALICRDLIIIQGANVVFSPGTSLTCEGNFENNGSLVMQSGSCLITEGAVDGEVQIVRNTTFNKKTFKYSVMSTPLTTATTQDLGVVYDLSEAQAQYTLYNGALEVGKGYFSAKTGTVTFTGVPNTGEITVTDLTYTPGVDAEFRGYNLVGNPYPCAISADMFLDENSADLEPYVWLWNNKIPDNTRATGGDYLLYSRDMGVVSGAEGTSFDGFIGTAQGFMVQLKSDATSPASVAFKGEMRVAGENSDDSFLRTARQQTKLQRLKLTIRSDQGEYDETLIALAQDATVNSDRYDIQKLKGYVPGDDEPRLWLSSQLAGADMITQGLPLLTGSTEQLEIPLSVEAGNPGQLEVTLAENSLSDQINVYLRDKFSDEIHNLQKPYSYKSFENHSADRFSLILSKGDLPPQVLGNHGLGVFADKSELNLWFEENLQQGEVTVLDQLGKTVASFENIDTENRRITLPVQITANRLYILKVESEGRAYTKKFIKHN